MKQLSLALAAIVFAAGTALAAQQAPPPAQEKPTAEAAKAPASPAGKWNLNMEGPQGAMSIVLDVKIDAENKVTGTLNGPSGPSPIKGELKEGMLSFSLSVDAGGTPMEIWIESKVDDKDKMTGTIYIGDMGNFPFTGERAKDAK